MDTAGSGGLCYLAGQVVSEYEVCEGASLPGGGSRRPLEEALTALRKGALLLKHGRHGKPKVHFFRVTGCDTLLKWRSASGSVKQVRLRNVSEVVAGQVTEVFKRYPLREPACSFSLRYRDDEGTSRTLDLTCADEQQYNLWYTGLSVVAEQLRSMGTPVAPPAPSGNGGITASTNSGISPAELVALAANRTLQRTSSAAAALDRVPCDLLAWGSAQRAPPVPVSLRSVMGVAEDCWQHRSQPGLAPGGLQLDAYRAAVGRKHAAVVTATGTLYTWGEGRGGKLGLGHDQDQPQPQRVRHGLEGQCVVAVACGDDCTAALTDGGELYMWGRLHADTRPQLVPLHVRGDLRGRRVAQVSCGPFHCAAVSSDGQLFTWGEGFGGKLGHGDQSNRTHPTLVQSFAGRQVLEVACGVWHTAAVLAEGEAQSGSTQTNLHKLDSSPAELLLGGSDLLPAVTSPPHAAHHRNNSTSSAFSEASLYHDGQGGSLYTWGGVNESVAFGNSEKRDSNKGCLGHGDADLYRGQLLPVRVGGALENRQVRHIAAGSHLTVAVTTGGRVFQMGVTGASSARNCPWEGATAPELVRGLLTGFFVEEVSCGMHHVVVLARPLDRKQGRPADHAQRMALAWGRSSEGQLGVRSFEDSAAPLLIDSLRGRHVLQVTCGGSNTMAVCEHDVRRFELESREEADAASRALFALMSEAKQLRIQAPGDGLPPRSGSGSSGSGMGMGGIVRRSFSMIAPRSSGGSSSVAGGSAALVPYAGGGPPPELARISSGSMRSVGGGSNSGSIRRQPSLGQMYSTLMSAHRAQKANAQQRARAERATISHAALPSSSGAGFGGYGNWGFSSEPAANGSSARVVSVGSPVKASGPSHTAAAYARRSTYAGGGVGDHRGMASSRSFTLSGARSYGGRSDMSSMSSMPHRPHSDDGVPEQHEVDSALGGGARMLSSSDMAGLDDLRTSSSVTALHDELAEKNRIIERLQRKLEKMQRQQQQQAAAAAPAAARGAAVGGAAADSEERLRETVRMSAGAFREAQQNGSPPQQQQQQQRHSNQQRQAVSPASTRSAGTGHALRPNTIPSGPAQAAQAQEEQERAECTANLETIEQMLAKKEAHLEGQQQKLAAWAAELQRKEALLAVQQARMASRSPTPSAALAQPGSEAGTPQPIPSESPVLPGRAGARVPAPGGAAPVAAVLPAVSPHLRRLADEMASTPAQGSSATSRAASCCSYGSASTLPASPQAPNEWTEEFEQGVILTFTTEGGTKKLKRIRFNRSLFSADSAKEWYEANKHRLAQPTGAPRMSTTSSRSLSSSPAPSGFLAAAESQQQQQPRVQQQGAEPAVGQRGQQEQDVAAPADEPVSPRSLHYRQTSRNLSFDARELAAFHERLHQVGAQQQQAAGGGTPGAGQRPHRPSRLSQMSQMAAAALAGSPGMAGSGGGAEQALPPAAAGTALPESPFSALAQQQQQEGATPQKWQAARSGSDAASTGTASQPHSRKASATATELAAVRSAARLYAGGSSGGGGSRGSSGGSSPIRASGGSRTSSPLSKQRSVASTSTPTLAKQLSSPKPELARAAARVGAAAAKDPQQAALFTPRSPAADKQQGGAAAPPAAAAGSGEGEQEPSLTSVPSASPQSSPAVSGGGAIGEGATPSTSSRSSGGLSGTLGRLRRSITGGSGSSNKKQGRK